MSRCDDSRFDEFLQVSNGRVDSVLDGRAGEVVMAEQKFDGLIRIESAGFEADIDDAGG